MKKVVFAIALLTSLAMAQNASAITWTVIFKKTQAIATAKSPKTLQWCKEHSPTALVTTPAQIKGEGIVSVNGIKVRYKKYVVTNKDNLSFAVAYAELSGKDKLGHKWSMPTKIYEQAFDQSTFFNSVWSNQYCRGYMYGYPTVTK